MFRRIGRWMVWLFWLVVFLLLRVGAAYPQECDIPYIDYKNREMITEGKVQEFVGPNNTPMVIINHVGLIGGSRHQILVKEIRKDLDSKYSFWISSNPADEKNKQDDFLMSFVINPRAGTYLINFHNECVKDILATHDRNFLLVVKRQP